MNHIEAGKRIFLKGLPNVIVYGLKTPLLDHLLRRERKAAIHRIDLPIIIFSQPVFPDCEVLQGDELFRMRLYDRACSAEYRKLQIALVKRVVAFGF